MVHEAKGYDAHDSVKDVHMYIERYKDAQTLFTSPRLQEQIEIWKPPMQGMIKINYDASFRHETKEASVGIISRDINKHVLACKRTSFQFIPTPEVAEAFATGSAVILAYDLKFAADSR